MPNKLNEFGNFDQPQAEDNVIDDENSFEKTLEHNRKLRDYKEENWFYWTRVISLIVVSGIAAILVGIYLWHVVGPEKMKWMSQENLSRLESFSHTVVTGVVASLSISLFFKK